MVSSFGAPPPQRAHDARAAAHPSGRAPRPVQLFGHDPDVMRSAAGDRRAGRRRPDRHQHGLSRAQGAARRGPGRRCCGDPSSRSPGRRAAAEGSGRPVTVKLRSGLEPGDRSGVELALRLVEEAGVAAIALHPRSAAVQHRGSPGLRARRRARRALGDRVPGDRLRRPRRRPRARAGPTRSRAPTR